MTSVATTRSMGLWGATSVGVGAIVGGGILALAGTAFASAGPSAVLAFLLNGAVAVVTALSFAEMSTRFPQSGGTYTFARRVLSVEAAFAVGWVVWFASIVAAVLYAIGFAAFASAALERLAETGLGTPGWASDRAAILTLAAGATVVLALALLWRPSGGGAWINVVKLLVFAILIAGGLWALARRPPSASIDALQPFFAHGALGLVTAMGFTFIAMQGFDLIAAVAGEVREPRQTLPRSMLLSLGIALAIYMPLLLIIPTVGMAAGESVTAASARHPETIVAVAAQRYLGNFGYWMVMAAGILSMLSALQANLLAASRVAATMARDRTLPRRLGRTIGRSEAPAAAMAATAILVIGVVLLVADVGAAGAAASLIFLVTFALVHVLTILARRRSRVPGGTFRVPLFPWLPIFGATACLALAVFQGVMVPAAGVITTTWLGLGSVLFLALLGRRARVHDAHTEAVDPQLVQLRGRSPLVLVPIANPAHAPAMVAVANALAPPEVGRVLLLSVVTVNDPTDELGVERGLAAAQTVLKNALTASFRAGLTPEALATVAANPWPEIVRVARAHRCESMLMGMSGLPGRLAGGPIEQVLSAADCDAVVLRSPDDWVLSDAQRILVPVGGRGENDVMRARLIGSLRRSVAREVRYLRVMPEATREDRWRRAEAVLRRVAEDEAQGEATVDLVRSDDAVGRVVREAAAADLVILGIQRGERGRRTLGEFSQRITNEVRCATILISRRG